MPQATNFVTLRYFPGFHFCPWLARTIHSRRRTGRPLSLSPGSLSRSTLGGAALLPTCRRLAPHTLRPTPPPPLSIFGGAPRFVSSSAPRSDFFCASNPRCSKICGGARSVDSGVGPLTSKEKEAEVEGEGGWARGHGARGGIGLGRVRPKSRCSSTGGGQGCRVRPAVSGAPPSRCSRTAPMSSSTSSSPCPGVQEQAALKIISSK